MGGKDSIIFDIVVDGRYKVNRSAKDVGLAMVTKRMAASVDKPGNIVSKSFLLQR